MNTNRHAADGTATEPPPRLPCLATLRGVHAALTEAERRVADWVLVDPSLLLHSSITQVAAASGVGVSTVSRLSAKLGYASFPDLKIALAGELLNPDRSALEPVQAEDDAAAVAAKVLGGAAQHLVDTAALLDPAELERAAAAIIRARRIELYAEGMLTGSIARQAEARLRLRQIPCAALTERWEHAPARRCSARTTSLSVSRTAVTLRTSPGPSPPPAREGRRRSA